MIVTPIPIGRKKRNSYTELQAKSYNFCVFLRVSNIYRTITKQAVLQGKMLMEMNRF